MASPHTPPRFGENPYGQSPVLFNPFFINSPPQPKAPKKSHIKRNKSNGNKSNNYLPPNRLLTNEELKKRNECKLILNEIQNLHEINYNCCEDICNNSKIINNTEIIALLDPCYSPKG